MKLTFLIFVVFEQLFFNPHLVSGKWPEDLKTEFCFQTQSPLHIDSTKAKPLTGLSPLEFVIPSNDKLHVTNNGKSIVANLVQHSTKATVNGSVFKDNVYEFRQIFVVFNNDYSDRCATTIDGLGTPMEFVQIYVKREYGSIEKARQKRDGMVIVVKRILVKGHIPNSLFPPFEKILKKLKKPGSSVIASAPTVCQWYDILPSYNSYFISPGSYIDPQTGDRYQSAHTVTFFPNAFPNISVEQFGPFQELLAKDGSPLTNTLPTFEKGKIPLVQAEGVKVNYLK